jgi:D-serine deaminase-like pyridoxal phosphate-dependent protein
MKVSDLETPVLLVDQEKLLANLKEMQEMASKAGVDLRPHTKTHKCPEIAKLQLHEGASGICVQKLGEAQVMVDAGIKDIFITNEIVEPTKIERLVALQENASVKVAIDSLANAKTIGKAAVFARQVVPVLVEVDCGMNRCGIPMGHVAVNFARELSRIKGLQLQGIMAYEGQFYHIANKAERYAEAKLVAKKVVDTARAIRRTGLNIQTVSCGSTPTAAAVAVVPGVTEIQPGNYVFYDEMQVKLNSTKRENCALHVLATVISAAEGHRVVLDAGIKAFSYDYARFPRPLGLRGSQPVGISEEHLVLQLRRNGQRPRIGQKLEFIPYHACTTVNMYDWLYVVRNGETLSTWPVAGRGKLL